MLQKLREHTQSLKLKFSYSTGISIITIENIRLSLRPQLFFSYPDPNPTRRLPTQNTKPKLWSPVFSAYLILYVESHSVHAHMAWSQKFRLTPESLFQTPIPLLFQNFWIRVRKFSNLRILLLFRLRCQIWVDFDICSPNPILIRRNWIRTSSDPQFFRIISPIQSCSAEFLRIIIPIQSWSAHAKPCILFCIMKQNWYSLLAFPKLKKAVLMLPSKAKTLLEFFCHRRTR